MIDGTHPSPMPHVAATHPCPGCAATVPTNPRYPLAFCADCLRDATTDSHGTPLEICEDPRMALAYRIGGRGEWQPAATILCRVRGQKARINQARFGGIIAEPAPDPGPSGWGIAAV